MSHSVILQITRFSPEQDAEPRFERHEVSCHNDWVVLDALNYIKDEVDGSLTYRWSCRMGICGSCGVLVNGEPKLSCATFLSAYAGSGKPVRIEPLRYFPIIRDLVVDISDFMRKLRSVTPWLVRQQEKPIGAGEYLQTPEEHASYQQYSMCINCLLCYAACPVYGLDPGFIGPAAIALAQRYNMDSRDEGAEQRMDVLAQHEGVWGCTFVGECTKACPKHVDPAGAIQRYKIAAALDRFRTVLLPWAGR
jgi:fumarate reductase iron-sulfur subunit